MLVQNLAPERRRAPPGLRESIGNLDLLSRGTKSRHPLHTRPWALLFMIYLSLRVFASDRRSGPHVRPNLGPAIGPTINASLYLGYYAAYGTHTRVTLLILGSHSLAPVFAAYPVEPVPCTAPYSLNMHQCTQAFELPNSLASAESVLTPLKPNRSYNAFPPVVDSRYIGIPNSAAFAIPHCR
ncbi:hypothetical protein M8818_004390 [Zalaria obscura]|uniref:Uncharacterized protein n=1 Tax=Zalaria obscura TaxID=2024903 RepID=A0ACC3SB00_9PEZI